MRRILFTFCLVFVASSVFGYPSQRLDSLRYAIYDALLMAQSGNNLMTSARLTTAINLAQSQVADDFLCYSKIDTVGVTKDEEGIELPSDFLEIEAVFRMIGDTLRIPLVRADIDSLRRYYPTAGDNSQKNANLLSPGHYLAWGDRLLLHPKVRKDTSELGVKVDSFLILYYVDPPMVSVATDTLHIPKKYVKAVFDFACATAAQWLGQYERSSVFRAQYERALQRYWDKRLMQEEVTK